MTVDVKGIVKYDDSVSLCAIGLNSLSYRIMLLLKNK